MAKGKGKLPPELFITLDGDGYVYTGKRVEELYAALDPQDNKPIVVGRYTLQGRYTANRNVTVAPLKKGKKR